MNRYFLFLFLLTICCSILFSCERNISTDSTETSIKVGLISKATVRPDDGTTCRIIIHDSYRDVKGVKGEGMYVYDKSFSTEYYRPARLDSKGEFIAYDDYAGVPPYAWPTNNSSVYATYIVPGYSYDSDYFISYRPECEAIAVAQCYVSNLDINGVFNPTGYYLWDIRTQMSFNFYKSANENVEDFTVTNPRLVGTGNPGSEVKFNPINKTVHVPSAGERPIPLTSVTDAKVSSGRIMKYTTRTEDYMFVSSGTYEPNPKLTLRFTLNQGSASTDVVLNINETTGNSIGYFSLGQMYKNVYSVTVMSNSVALSLDVYDCTSAADWESVHSSSDTVDVLLYSLELGRYSLDGWQSHGDIGNQIIND